MDDMKKKFGVLYDFHVYFQDYYIHYTSTKQTIKKYHILPIVSS